ncbi:hypothetical protein IPZ70_03665 [Streptomyces polychromogenes]|nr:hypothetical protein [Streptomyces polychromogenes]
MGGKQQTVRFEDLDEEDQRRARIRLAHVLETKTGYRSGSVFWAEEGEPRPQFNPARTTLTQRREAKVAELAALASEDAKFLGLRQVGERTLRRIAAASAEDGLVGLADGRWTRELSGHPLTIPEFAEAIRAVHAESLHRSRLGMTTRERLIHQYVREKHGPELEEKLPHRTTLAKLWKEWFGPDSVGGRANPHDPRFRVGVIPHPRGHESPWGRRPWPVALRRDRARTHFPCFGWFEHSIAIPCESVWFPMGMPVPG